MNQQSLKIAMIHRDLPCDFDRGGVSYHVHYLANHLVERGHEVTIFTTDPKPEDAKYQVRQIHLSSRAKESKLSHLYLWPIYAAQQDYSGFDLLHAHGDSQFLRTNGVPLIRTFYGSALGEAISATTWRRKISQFGLFPFEILSGKLAARSIAISYATVSHLPFIRTVIPCGVDLELFNPSENKSINPSILFIGMLAGRKRGKLTIDVFKNEIKTAIPNSELWMVCPEQVEEEGVTCFGKVPLQKLTELYQKAWIFASSSSYEGFGIPYIEALASGTPIVTTSNVGAKEVLQEGKYGIICKEDKLGQTLIKLIQDQDLRNVLIDQGLQYVRQFDWGNIVNSYEQVYWDLLSPDPVGREC